MTQLCNCSSCEQAIERGVEFVCKQIRDGDCPYFVAGVALAVNSVVASAMAMDEGGRHHIDDVLYAMQIQKKIDYVIGQALKKDMNRINNRIRDAILAAKAAREQEDKLAKGD